MNTTQPGQDWDGIGQTVSPEASATAKEALGIASESQVIPLDVSKLALFVSIDHEGKTTVNATITRRAAAASLRRLADRFDNEWKTEERTAQKELRQAAKEKKS